MMDTENLLYLTAGAVALELLIFGALLARRGRFRWVSAGFWAWASFGLYYVVNPFFVALTGNNLERYSIRLEIAGGIPRGLWVLFVILLGIGVFFIAYLREGKRTADLPPSAHNANAAENHIPLLGTAILLLFVAFGFYSLVQFRTFNELQDVLIVGGRFVGNVTGYQNSGYNFLFFPTAFFLLARRPSVRLLGWGLFILFLVLSLPHGWSRFTLVSMVLLASLTTVIRVKRRWPRVVWLAAVVLLAAVLQVRGHAAWTFREAPDLLSETLQQSVQNSSEVLAAQDTAMLATFYIESYLRDEFTGYQYGLPLLNYALTGWIPSRFFPQKYFLVDWLQYRQGDLPLTIEQLLYGAKSSLIGNLYSNGWIIGVALGMWGLGYLSRKLDAALASGNRSAQAVGVAILSQAWMVWGSGSTWGLVRLGFIMLPALGLWLTSRWAKRYRPQPRGAEARGVRQTP